MEKERAITLFKNDWLNVMALNAAFALLVRMVQTDLIESNAFTGFVMNMYSYLDNNSNPTQKEIEHLFDGNICRCTGYRPIFDAMKTVRSRHGSCSD